MGSAVFSKVRATVTGKLNTLCCVPMLIRCSGCKYDAPRPSCGQKELVEFCKSHVTTAQAVAYSLTQPIVITTIGAQFRTLAGFVVGVELPNNGGIVAQTGFNSFFINELGLIDDCTGYTDASVQSSSTHAQ
jgi:hypothetical protein